MPEVLGVEKLAMLRSLRASIALAQSLVAQLIIQYADSEEAEPSSAIADDKNKRKSLHPKPFRQKLKKRITRLVRTRLRTARRRTLQLQQRPESPKKPKKEDMTMSAASLEGTREKYKQRGEDESSLSMSTTSDAEEADTDIEKYILRAQERAEEEEKIRRQEIALLEMALREQQTPASEQAQSLANQPRNIPDPYQQSA